MDAQQQNYYQRVAMATTQFITTLDMLRNLKREGEALEYLDPTLIPVGTAETPLTPQQEALATQMRQAIDAFEVFEQQGIFAEITGEQKVRAKKLYSMLRTGVVIQS